jgi:hypothetical protein
MHDTCCRSFFLEPVSTFHRQYEALRAFFVNRHKVKEVAATFGYSETSLRSMICRFRAGCQHGEVPPFSLSPDAGGLPAKVVASKRLGRKPRRRRMGVP